VTEVVGNRCVWLWLLMMAMMRQQWLGDGEWALWTMMVVVKEGNE